MVVAEDFFTAHVLFELRQEAVRADINVKRIVDLPTAESSGQRLRLAERRHSQIGKRLPQACTTESARLSHGLWVNIRTSEHLILRSRKPR